MHESLRSEVTQYKNVISTKVSGVDPLVSFEVLVAKYFRIELCSRGGSRISGKGFICIKV